MHKTGSAIPNVGNNENTEKASLRYRDNTALPKPPVLSFTCAKYGYKELLYLLLGALPSDQLKQFCDITSQITEINRRERLLGIEIDFCRELQSKIAPYWNNNHKSLPQLKLEIADCTKKYVDQKIHEYKTSLEATYESDYFKYRHFNHLATEVTSMKERISEKLNSLLDKFKAIETEAALSEFGQTDLFKLQEKLEQDYTTAQAAPMEAFHDFSSLRKAQQDTVKQLIEQLILHKNLHLPTQLCQLTPNVLRGYLWSLVGQVNISETDAHKNTLLHKAYKHKQWLVAHLLETYKIDSSQLNENGQTAAEYANLDLDYIKDKIAQHSAFVPEKNEYLQDVKNTVGVYTQDILPRRDSIRKKPVIGPFYNKFMPKEVDEQRKQHAELIGQTLAIALMTGDPKQHDGFNFRP